MPTAIDEKCDVPSTPGNMEIIASEINGLAKYLRPDTPIKNKTNIK